MDPSLPAMAFRLQRPSDLKAFRVKLDAMPDSPQKLEACWLITMHTPDSTSYSRSWDWWILPELERLHTTWRSRSKGGSR